MFVQFREYLCIFNKKMELSHYFLWFACWKINKYFLKHSKDKLLGSFNIYFNGNKKYSQYLLFSVCQKLYYECFISLRQKPYAMLTIITSVSKIKELSIYKVK